MTAWFDCGSARDLACTGGMDFGIDTDVDRSRLQCCVPDRGFWGLAITMVLRRNAVSLDDRLVARLIRSASALLALGDTGHAGFRVLAYASGDLDALLALVGQDIGFVGLGALSTAVAVTLFCVLKLAVWRVRFDRRFGWFEYLLLAAVAARSLLMIPAANQWNNPYRRNSGRSIATCL